MSDFVTTPNLGLYKPTYDADAEQWGNHLNSNADTLDAALATTGAGVRFLPLAGGALTGALSGTTAAFTGAGTGLAVTNNATVGTGSANWWQLNGAGGFVQMQVMGAGNASALINLLGSGSFLGIANGSGGYIASFADASGGAAVANSLTVYNGAAGQPLQIRSTGSDANRQIQLQPGGAGGVMVAAGTVNYSGATFNPQLGLGVTLSGSTTAAAGTANVFDVTVPSDTAATAVGGMIQYGSIRGNFGGAGARGNRQGFAASVSLTATSSNTPQGGAYVGIVGSATIGASDNGTGLTPSTVGGAAWGGNFYAITTGGAQNVGGVLGLEINPAIGSGTTCAELVGVQVVPTGAHVVRGAFHNDTAYRVALQDGGMGIDCGLDLSAPGAAWCYQPTASLIMVHEPHFPANGQALAAWGIDFTGPVFSGGFCKSTGFSVDGGGNASAQSMHLGGFALTQSGATLTIGQTAQTSSFTSIAAGGTNWTVGDKATTTYGGVYQVTTVSAGAVTGLTQLVAGTSASPPANPVATTATNNYNGGMYRPGSAGSGLTLNLAWSGTGNATNITGGLHFTGAPEGTLTALGNHLDLYNGQFGIGVASGAMSIVASQNIYVMMDGAAVLHVTDSQVATYGSTSLLVAGNFGCNGAGPIAKPTVTGAKGSNAALASLLTALAAYGLVTDSTSA
jgi:hypothetical protein